MATYAEITPMIACEGLREAGVSHGAETLHIGRREGGAHAGAPGDQGRRSEMMDSEDH